LDGPVLTPVGAERAGNKDGTIPAWTGVPIPMPKGFKSGSGNYINPFADEKPLFSINQKNMAQYADKLNDGVKVMMTRYPDYRIDVYKTHRTTVYPQWLNDNAKKNATACHVTKKGLAVEGQGCHGGPPFPIPKEGLEVYWNHSMYYLVGKAANVDMENWNISSTGKASLASRQQYIIDSVWFDPERENDWKTLNIFVTYVAPARRAGEMILLTYVRDYVDKELIVWQYLPGQRRVRLAPDVCCDTPSASTGGASTYDDANVFLGNPKRFDWKIIGKKEMYIPYNVYRFMFHSGPEGEVLLKHFVNPDIVRWELHRVWKIEATLKPGMRHVYHKRIFYADEDSWAFIIGDNFDKRGNLYRMTLSNPFYMYDSKAFCMNPQTYYDLISNSYAIYGWTRGRVLQERVEKIPKDTFSPDALAGGGLR